MTEKISAVQKAIDTVINFFVTYSFQVLGAVIILVVGLQVAGWTAKFILSICEKNKLDITLSRFLAGAAKILILIFSSIIALGNFGVTIAPFIAALGAVAFGTTYALQGPLSNYCAGLTIVMGRPFLVGDTITVAGQSGVVKEVKLAATILADEDGTRITIPNKEIVGQILHNSKEHRAAEGAIGIGYASNPEKAIEAVQRVLREIPDVAKKPAPIVGIREFADSSVNIGYRYWVPTERFVQISHAVNLAIYKAFKQNNIDIPFPQREIRILSETSPAPTVNATYASPAR